MSVHRFKILALLLIAGTWAASFGSVAHGDGQSFTVFDVRKTLPLNDQQKVYKDYYVNIGEENGVKAGAVLSVYRKIPVIDIYRNKAQGDLVVPVAQLKVIQVQRSMSVARILSTSNPKNIPVVQYETVMMGDRVEIVTADAAPAPASQEEEDEPAPAPVPETSSKQGTKGDKTSMHKPTELPQKLTAKNVSAAVPTEISNKEN